MSKLHLNMHKLASSCMILLLGLLIWRLVPHLGFFQYDKSLPVEKVEEIQPKTQPKTQSQTQSQPQTTKETQKKNMLPRLGFSHIKLPAPPSSPTRSTIKPEIAPLKPATLPDISRKQETPPLPSKQGSLNKKTTSPAPSTTSHVKGRGLLKILEFGKGPDIELFWPKDKIAQAALYGYLSHCLQMQTAILDQNKFFLPDQTESWQPNADFISGFLRQAAGNIQPEEDLKLRKTKSQHTLSAKSEVVRLFPRGADAKLLGGLYNLIGEGYMKGQKITGDYHLQNRQLLITNIQVNGQAISGQIDLTPVHTPCS